MTQTQIILATLRKRYPEWIYSYQLQKVETPFGWIGPSGERCCRELREAGLIGA